MARRHALVAEHAVELEDALEAADEQALEVELGRDAQVEIDVERVVVGHERARRGAAGNRLHHRRLDLDEAARGEELAQELDDLRAAAKRRAHLLVGDQVEVALAVARLDVGQAMPLLRQRAQRLGEHAKLLGARW